MKISAFRIVAGLVLAVAVVTGFVPIAEGGVVSPSYGVTDVTPMEAVGGTARGLNDHGTVVGSALIGEGPGLQFHAFAWSEGEAMLLPEVTGAPGVVESHAHSVNNDGIVVGIIFYNEGADLGSFVWNTEDGTAFLVNAGSAGIDAIVYDINDNGVMVGTLRNVESNTNTAAMWPSPTAAPIDLGSFGGSDNRAYGISGSFIVGSSTDDEGSQWAFRMENIEGEWLSLNSLIPLIEGGGSAASDVNDVGVAVGSSQGAAHNEAVLWTASGELVYLGVLDGGTSSYATAVNNDDVVVGQSETSEEDLAFLSSLQTLGSKTIHVMRPIDDLIVDRDFPSIVRADDINNAGRIAATTENGRAVMLTPIPSPDLNGDGIVDGSDLGILLGAWGSSSSEPDLNGDGIVDGSDLGILLGAWG